MSKVCRTWESDIEKAVFEVKDVAEPFRNLLEARLPLPVIHSSH